MAAGARAAEAAAVRMVGREAAAEVDAAVVRVDLAAADKAVNGLWPHGQRRGLCN